MKKKLSCMAAGVMVLTMLAGAATVQAEGVELNVTTTFAGEDGNAQNFKNAVAAWEKRPETR